MKRKSILFSLNGHICLRMQACSVTWLLSGTFIKIKARENDALALLWTSLSIFPSLIKMNLRNSPKK